VCVFLGRWATPSPRHISFGIGGDAVHLTRSFGGVSDGVGICEVLVDGVTKWTGEQWLDAPCDDAGSDPSTA